MGVVRTYQGLQVWQVPAGRTPEVSSLLVVAERRGHLTGEYAARPRETSERVAAMLTRLLQTLQGR